MDSLQAKQVIYGTNAELWIDGDEMAEAEEFKATLTPQKTEIKMVRHMVSGYKVTGYQGKGSIKLHKVSSYMIKKLAQAIKEGKQISSTIVSKLDDPDAIGAERIVIKDANFDSVDLANWAAGKVGEESYSFTFSDFEVLDYAL